MTKLRVLLVEDSDLDAAHLQLELRRGGFDVDLKRVETRPDFEAALARGSWDVIIGDYHLPRFSAPEALEICRAAGNDIPFIVVSGAIGEETAVELMRAGANDYLLKDHLTRLAAAVTRELYQREQRRGKRRAEDLFRAVLRASPLAGMLVDRMTGVIIDGSDMFRKQFLDGRGAGERGLLEVIEFSHPERIEQLLARGSGTAWHTVYYVKDVARIANVRCYTVDYEGASYAYVVLEDITEQHYLKAAFDAVPDPLLIVSSQQQLLYANRRAEEIFGDLYFAMEVAPLLRQDDAEDHWWRALDRYEERRVLIKEQPYDANAVPFRFAGESEASTILTLRDVSSEEELRRLATLDALTGIFNMRHFDAVLSEQIHEGGTFALLDLDFFKPINDELGHAAGDAALKTFTSLIRNDLRPGDVFARVGGDEFAVFFPATPVESAVKVVRSIYERLARTPFRFDDATRVFSVSSGIATVNGDDSLEAVKRRADEALYEAKRQGRARWVVWGE